MDSMDNMKKHTFGRRTGRFLVFALAAAVFAGNVPAEDAPPTPETTPAAAAETPAPAGDAASAPAAAEPAAGDWVNGHFSTGIDTAWDDKASDIELNQFLRLNVDPPSVPKLHFHTSLWTTENLDGNEDSGTRLYGIDDAYDEAVRVRLLDLYMQADDVLGGATLRLGRQRITDGPLFNRIDGLYLNWDLDRWNVYVYGGVRASIYNGHEDNLALGGGASYQLTKSTRIGVDAFYGNERRHSGDDVQRSWSDLLFGRDYPRSVASELDNHMVALNLYQRLGTNHWLSARATFQEDGADELALDLSGYIQAADITYLLSYHNQLDRVEDRINQVTGFYRILGPHERYHHFHADLQRPITKKLTLGLETDWHIASNDSIYTANRDYLRTALVLSGKDVYKGMNFRVALENWDATGESDMWIVTGEIGRKWKAYNLAFGVNYEQYRDEYVDYNPWPNRLNIASFLFVPGVSPGIRPGVWLTDTANVVTRENIYSFYSRFTWEIDKRQRLMTRVTLEEDDGPDSPYWRVQASYEIDF